MTIDQARGDRVVGGHYRALPDQVSENLMTLVLNLATELWTLRDRTRLLQDLLDEKGILSREEFDRRRDERDQLDAMAEDRDAYVARILRSVVDAHQWVDARDESGSDD